MGRKLVVLGGMLGFLLGAGDLTAQVRVAPQASYASDADFGIGARAIIKLPAFPGLGIIGSFDYFFPASVDLSGFGVDISATYWEINGNLFYAFDVNSPGMLPYLGAYFLEAQMNQREYGPMGNHHPRMAPHNVYACTDQETWVAIAVVDDAEWQRLCEALGRPDWALQERFQTTAGRLQHQEELDRGLAAWTRQYTPAEVAQRLQAHGIAAGPVLSAADAYADPHLRARARWPGCTARCSRTSPASTRRAWRRWNRPRETRKS